MGGNGAEHARGTGATEGLCCAANGRAGCHDVVDQKHTQTVRPVRGGETSAWEIEPAGAAATRLPSQAVSPQERVRWFRKTACRFNRQQLRGSPRAAHPPQAMGRDGADDVNRVDPGLSGDSCREAGSERACKVVPTSMFERHNHRAKDTVVLPPDHRCPLRRGPLNTVQALL